MPIFRYTVANKEGKKLSGTIESADEQSAKSELNSLGFSILELKEGKESSKEKDDLKTKFVFEAIDQNAKLISGTISSKNEKEALTKLREEYSLNVSAIWPQNASQKQVEEARKRGNTNIQQTNTEEEIPKTYDPKQQKKELGIRTKIDNTLSSVHQLLQTFDKEFNPTQKSEIQKRIDKLLRIKNSKNLDYILQTAKELLEFIKDQTTQTEQKGNKEEKIKLVMETNKIIGTLDKNDKKTISTSIVEKIDKIRGKREKEDFLSDILESIKKLLIPNTEVLQLKQKIKECNTQLKEFSKLYLKEPSGEYKEKVKEKIKNTWQERKSLTKNLKVLKKQLKAQKKPTTPNDSLFISFVEELNSFSGWLLTFYIIYYFCALYLNTKDFGLTQIPAGFEVYASRLFKYILTTLFLLHATTALKINFFKKSTIATVIMIPLFLLGSVIALLNF